MHCIYHALFVSQGGGGAEQPVWLATARARAQERRERSSGGIKGEESRVCCSAQRVASSQQPWPCQVLRARVGCVAF